MTTPSATGTPTLSPGFSDPVMQGQWVFRRLLEAMSRPGRIESIGMPLEGPASLDLAATAVALALVDFETPLYIAPSLSSPETEGYLKFHCGTRIVPRPRDAAFAILDQAPEDLNDFSLGTDEYPENGATLIIQQETIETGGPLVLSGPGIKDEHRLSLPDVPVQFWGKRAAQRRYFPRGLDLIFVSGADMVAIPRTTTVTNREPGE